MVVVYVADQEPCRQQCTTTHYRHSASNRRQLGTVSLPTAPRTSKQLHCFR